MTSTTSIATEAILACEKHGVTPTEYFFTVDISRQSAALFLGALTPGTAERRYQLVETMRCSTSKFGIGEVENSQMTPRGLHRIARKIGDGCPAGTVFESRRVVGYTWEGRPNAPITTRILWLEGLEPGFNQGGQVDSFKRYIYIHGTGDETTLGRPASHGCIHLAADDLIPLYSLLPEGTLVWITEK